MIHTLEEFQHALAELHRAALDKVECAIDGASLIVTRDDDWIYLRAHLVDYLANQPDSLRQTLQLGLVSAFHFEAGLACLQGDHTLWLTRSLPASTGLDVVTDEVETLLEQRDIWRDSQGMTAVLPGAQRFF